MASDGEPCVGGHHELTSENERLADQERDPAGADREPAGADREPAGADRDPAGEIRRTPLEHHARSMLRVYPAVYRRERGEEIIGTLLEASDGRTWPRLRDVRALTLGGLRARAAQNRQRTAEANLRVAVMAGLAIFAAFWFATHMDGGAQFVWFAPGSAAPVVWSSWLAVVTALLAGVTVVLAWTAPRVGLLAGALAAAAVVVFALVIHDALRPHLVQVLGIAALAALAPRAGHPSRHWLWLPGVIAVSSPLIGLGMGDGWLGYWFQRYTPELSLLAVVIAGILWIAIDARLMVAVLIFLALTFVQMAVMEPYGAAIEALLPYLLAVATLTLAGSWLLRRQSARAIKSD
jgi:hypothetical protein